MDRNFFLAIALSLLVLITWSSFEANRRKGLEPETGSETTAQEGVETPQSTMTPPAPPAASTVPTPRAAERVQAPDTRLPEQRVVVENDWYQAEFTSYGGALRSWELKQYVDKSVPGDPLVQLVTLDGPDQVALATPLTGLGFGDLSTTDYRMERPTNRKLVFTRNLGDVRVRKTYEFDEEGYGFRLRIDVENESQRVLEPKFEVRWPARARPGPDFKEQALVAFQDGELERVPVKGLGAAGILGMGGGSMEVQVFPRLVEWAGVELRYFLAAFIPEVPRDAAAAFRPIIEKTAGDVAIANRAIEVPSGRDATREYRAYVGPKEADRLAAVGASLEKSVNVGWAWIEPLSRFFAWTLHLCHSVIPNYGVAIIVLTILVRLATAPLTAKQMRSMKKMGELQPRLKEIQAKHADDKQKQSEAMMSLYKETGVNPLGGCFPLLLQFPVFIGLYYALQSSIDLRQAPFFGWINDLSVPEALFTLPGVDLPVRLLPIIMGASMVLQQRMTPTTMDPQQARMMMTMMPIMFTVLFYQFPSGLVLYWMVSNLLAIAHQMWVNRQKTPA